MKKLLALSIVASLLPLAANAQRLPKGKLNPIRERTFDVLHYKANLEFEFAKGQVFGEATITFVPLRQIDSISLDAYYLSIKSVRDEKMNSSLPFRSGDKSVNIRFPKTKSVGDTIRMSIVYNAIPRAGMYFHSDPGNPQKYIVDTYGEGGLHANWLPIYNDVNDKFSTEMLITVPPPYTVISNGKLIETIMKGEGFTTYHWLQTLPHSNYLIALYVGDFEEGKLAPAFGTIPISYWVPRGRLNEGAYAFRNTTKMVEFFSGRFNYRYPWDKYDQIAVPDYSIGAMEHTGVTGHRACVLRDSTAPLDFGPPDFTQYSGDWSAEATISHELAHHWFGDNLTCRNLSYIWLNESFASYCMMLWDEKSVGRDQLLFDVQLAKKHYLNYVKKEHTIRPLEYQNFDNPDIIYNEEHTYLKGAIILHSLRTVLGDEQFFRAMSYYLHKHEFGNVVSDDLKIAIQEATGENIDWFFKQWITGAGHPQLEVSYKFVPERKCIDLSVKQVQPIVEGQGLFTFPVVVTIATRDKTWNEKVLVKEESVHFVLKCDEKPLMVSFDGEGSLVAEASFEKEVDELAYQATHDALPGRLWSMRQLAEKFPTDEATLETLSNIISTPIFWADAAEAAGLLGDVRTDATMKTTRQALASPDYRVRKSAVLGMTTFGGAAKDMLQEIVQNDSHADVVATAIVALAKVDKKLDIHAIEKQIARKAWYDEMAIACLKAFAELKNPAAVGMIRQYAGGSYNQYVREAAIFAWSECSPGDKDLHKMLCELARKATLRLQQKAIDLLGDLYAMDGVPTLEELVKLDFDANVTADAKDALEKIRRVHTRD
ncbi:MAG TPA: M1 family aminopeptidase [Bacteroidota bacterium]|nr:M1 family aminopeptidase [Bacteroidota bacterium]